MMSVGINSIAFLHIYCVDCYCFINGTNKIEVINLSKNVDLSDS